MILKPWLQVNSPRHIIEEGHEEGFEDGQETPQYTKQVLFTHSIDLPQSPQFLLVCTSRLAPVVTALLGQHGTPKTVGQIIGEIQLQKNTECSETRKKFTTEFLEVEDDNEEEEDIGASTAEKVVLEVCQYCEGTVVVEIKRDEVLLAHGFAKLLIEQINPAQVLVLAPGNTIADSHVNQLVVGKCEFVTHTQVPILQSPNFISGLGAAVLTRSQQAQVAATALVVQNVGTQMFERYQSETLEELTDIVATIFKLDSASAHRLLKADDSVAGLYL